MADEIKKEVRVLPGSDTFGEMIRVHGGSRQPRAYWLKVRAEERLAALIMDGERADRLAAPMPPVGWRDMRLLADMAKFSRLSAKKRLMSMRCRRLGLAKELAALSNGPPAKQKLLRPVIEKQLSELDNDILYLAEEIGEPIGERK